jgi:hypothetical protein
MFSSSGERKRDSEDTTKPSPWDSHHDYVMSSILYYRLVYTPPTGYAVLRESWCNPPNTATAIPWFI